MPPAAGGDFVFGPLRIDVKLKQLLRDDVVVPLPVQYVQVLIALVSQPGEILTKDDLIAAGWGDQSIGDGSLVQAIYKIRRALDPNHPARYVVAESGRGYRWVVPVTRAAARTTEADADAILASHQASSERLAILEGLQVDRILATEPDYGQLIGGARADDPAAYLGLAGVRLAQHEATRADAMPDAHALGEADDLTRRALRLNLRSADAWVTRGVVLHRMGYPAKARAAFREAVTLEPREWRRYLLWAWASWGRERLAAAGRMLELMPGDPIAHWLIATVLVARQALREAEAELDAGLATLARAATAPSAFPPIALFWLKGLLLFARGEHDEAMRAFERELAMDARGHIYWRETAANTWYGIGALHLACGRKADARAAFGEAVARIPAHGMATAGLALLTPRRGRTPSSHTPELIDAALAHAVLLARSDADGAARRVLDALTATPPGDAGWTIPLDPLLRVQQAPQAWSQVLQCVQDRAR